MTQRHTLVAYLVTILAIVGLALIASTRGALDSQVFGSAITGLIGIAGTFRPRNPTEQPA